MTREEVLGYLQRSFFSCDGDWRREGKAEDARERDESDGEKKGEVHEDRSWLVTVTRSEEALMDERVLESFARC